MGTLVTSSSWLSEQRAPRASEQPPSPDKTPTKKQAATEVWPRKHESNPPEDVYG